MNLQFKNLQDEERLEEKVGKFNKIKSFKKIFDIIFLFDQVLAELSKTKRCK